MPNLQAAVLLNQHIRQSLIAVVDILSEIDVIVAINKGGEIGYKNRHLCTERYVLFVARMHGS